MKTAYIARVQYCDFCSEKGKLEAADYDCSFAGIWAFACQHCYEEAGSPALGLGRGQRLIVQEGNI